MGETSHTSDKVEIIEEWSKELDKEERLNKNEIKKAVMGQSEGDNMGGAQGKEGMEGDELCRV